jgi:predicted amidohydrolase YtcJ
LIARPNAMILYSTLAKGPKLPLEYPVNSTRQFMRELNRLGVTSAIDAGGGYQNYPDDYQVIQQLAERSTADGAHCLQPVHPGTQGRAERFQELDPHVALRPGR